MKTNSKEIDGMEKVRKEFEEMSDDNLKKWTELVFQKYEEYGGEVIDAHINPDTGEFCIEYRADGIRLQDVFHIHNFDKDEGRIDWMCCTRTLDPLSTFIDDENEDKE
jgi:hypothetical protein